MSPGNNTSRSTIEKGLTEKEEKFEIEGQTHADLLFPMPKKLVVRYKFVPPQQTANPHSTRRWNLYPDKWILVAS
jgi:hypothetical protein